MARCNCPGGAGQHDLRRPECSPIRARRKRRRAGGGAVLQAEQNILTFRLLGGYHGHSAASSEDADRTDPTLSAVKLSGSSRFGTSPGFGRRDGRRRMIIFRIPTHSRLAARHLALDSIGGAFPRRLLAYPWRLRKDEANFSGASATPERSSLWIPCETKVVRRAFWPFCSIHAQWHAVRCERLVALDNGNSSDPSCHPQA